MHARTAWNAQPMPPADLAPQDVHASEASWGCESALPYLWRDGPVPGEDDDPGALPWPRAASS